MATHETLPQLRTMNGLTQLLVDGTPFVVLGGEVHNSSASSLEYMEGSWDKLVAVHSNTAIVPLYWELIEPEEEQFDLRLVDGLIEGARQHGLRLIFLWFGTWKNAMSTYVPAWVKTDQRRFPRAQITPGIPSGAISALSTEACQADARAFAEVMRHIRAVDGDTHTVLMMQVENETGLLGAARDHSPAAEAAFTGPVPTALMDYLAAHRGALMPELEHRWATAWYRSTGTWTEVFGDDASEVFMAWHIGQFVNAVVAAGKAEYPLPMFVNAWIRKQPEESAGTYPSGGPIPKMMDVWRAAAPQIDVYAVDTYLPKFKPVCAEFTLSSNPLLMPETGVTQAPAARAFYAVAQHDALCFSPFGIDGDYDGTALAESYQLLTDMMPLITRYQGTGQMAGILQEDAMEEDLYPDGPYRLHIRFTHDDLRVHLPGRGLIIALSPHEFIIAGAGFSLDFFPLPGETAPVEYLSIEEGTFHNGDWHPARRLNGDELGIHSRDTLWVRKVKVHKL